MFLFIMNTRRKTSFDLPSLAGFPAGSAHLAPGYVIQPEFGTIQGATYSSETEARGGNITVTKRIKYDHPDLRKLATASINKAYWVIRKFTAPLFGGLFFCPEADFPEMDAEMQEARNTAHMANLYAAKLKSPRETRIEIFPIPIDPSNPRVALRVGQSMHEFLKRLKESYTSDIQNLFTMEMRNSQNLHALVQGDQRPIVRAAVDASEAQRPIMIARYGGIRGVRALEKERGKVPDFDYGPIDNAIALFAPAERAFL